MDAHKFGAFVAKCRKERNMTQADTIIFTGAGVAFPLFPRATSQADMLACPFGDCREGQIPRSSAALQV